MLVKVSMAIYKLDCTIFIVFYLNVNFNILSMFSTSNLVQKKSLTWSQDKKKKIKKITFQNKTQNI